MAVKHRDSYPEFLDFCRREFRNWPELLHILVEIQLLFEHKPWSEPRRKEDSKSGKWYRTKEKDQTAERQATERRAKFGLESSNHSYPAPPMFTCFSRNAVAPTTARSIRTTEFLSSSIRTCRHRIRQVSCSKIFGMRSSRLHEIRLTGTFHCSYEGIYEGY